MVALLLMLGAAGAIETAGPSPSDPSWIGHQVDWREYVSRADMVWNGEQVTTLNWMQSPFAGNGMLGVMVNTEAAGCGSLWPGCSGAPDAPVLRLKIGRVDVWDTRVRGSQYSVGDHQYDTPRYC